MHRIFRYGYFRRENPAHANEKEGELLKLAEYTSDSKD